MAVTPPEAGAGLRVSVVYALPQQQAVVELTLPAGATLEQAVAASGLRERFAELRGVPLDAGIYNRPCAADTPLRDGDRVEIYRPLQIDPKEARRQRVARQRRSGGGLP